MLPCLLEIGSITPKSRTICSWGVGQNSLLNPFVLDCVCLIWQWVSTFFLTFSPWKWNIFILMHLTSVLCDWFFSLYNKKAFYLDFQISFQSVRLFSFSLLPCVLTGSIFSFYVPYMCFLLLSFQDQFLHNFTQMHIHF